MPSALRLTGLMRPGKSWSAWLWLALSWPALLLMGAGVAAQDLQAVPTLTARVMDTVGLLSVADRGALEQKLAAFEAQAGPQIVVLVVATTLPEDIASYVQRVGDTWKVGRRNVGDGLLLVVAKNDRKVWIAPAKALEGAVPDLAARQIVQNTITPAFKRGDFAGGISAGVDALIARLRGENLPAPQGPSGGGQGMGNGGFDWQSMAMFFFVGVPVVGGLLTAVLGRKVGAVVTAGGTGALAWWLSTSLIVAGLAGVVAMVLVGVMGVGSAMGRSRGGFGGGPPIIWGGSGRGGGAGGGGFSSGGGGDFGGGGAGGSW